uniref:Uncharacterized protein n=4 Tax=Triticinae TaxID=1648030 RepID=A0A453JXU2_AEGTS
KIPQKKLQRPTCGAVVSAPRRSQGFGFSSHNHSLSSPAPPVCQLASSACTAQQSTAPDRAAGFENRDRGSSSLSGSAKERAAGEAARLALPRLAMGIGYVIGILGGALLAHAAYATIQYRAVLKITEEEFSGPPVDVMMQLLLGLALCMWAGVSVPAKFLSVLPHSEENRIVSLPANLDFMIFNHRGRALPSDADLKLKI